MLPGFVHIDRLRSEEEHKSLLEAAHKDNHGCYAPTLVARKDGELVAYFSVNPPGVPVVLCWFNTELHSRETFSLINQIEALVASNGAVAISWPVPKTSPLYPLMESMGYNNVGSYDLFVKKL